VDNSLPDTRLRLLASEWLKAAMRSVEGPKSGRWTETALAVKANVSRQALWSIRNQRADPKPDTIRAVADALGLPMPPLYESLRDSSAQRVREAPGPRYDAGLTRMAHLPERVTEDLEGRSAGDLRLLLRGAMMGGAPHDRLLELLDALEEALKREGD
jgi:transcriptional regulator with XRE-family HTH domain